MQIFDKPWGIEEILEVNDKYCVKRLFMKKGCRCSLQRHIYKHETLIVISGLLRVTGDVDVVMKPGDCLVLDVGVIHRMSAIKDTIYIEASTPELDDVIRIEDDYGRV
ncbi:hypothetical protein LCGC14_1191040 [marine sediment metagenome]|uniref:Mannose-6-phosphate isomerase type II C-terminal domain-containing protein n=1 Tax=marine sediment metagenome TaxID=412755 RepID=A0A0F9LP47_9ZZZZ